MNRRERRAQAKTGQRPGPPARLAPMLAEAVAYHQAGRLDEAERLYRQILAADPRQADCLHLAGVIAYQRGDCAAATDSIGQAIAVDGSIAAYHCNLGLALHGLDRFDEAEASYRRALRLAPSYPEAHSNLGVTLRRQGRLDEAVASLQAALAFRPDYSEAQSNLGVTLQDLGRFEDAAACYRAALATRPDNAEACSNLATALRELGRPEEAAEYCRRALALKPNYADAHSNLGNIYKEMGRLDDAVEAHLRAIALSPGLAQAHGNLGVALQELGRLDDAAAALRQAIALRPDDAEAHYNLGCTLLAAGDLAAGWPEYQWRWRRRDLAAANRHADRPAWRKETGPAEAGRGGTVLLWAEQGLGDTIQFARYVPEVVRTGWRVLLDVPPALAGLFAGMEGVTVIPAGAPLPPFDAQCPLLGLPLAFGTTLDTIPAALPYLRADPTAIAGLRAELDARPGLKVGLVWRGNPDHKRDRFRSIPLAVLRPLLQVPGVTFVSLQKEARPDEVDLLGREAASIDAGPHLGDFAATAALAATLDLVVTVDTAICHLAGTLGIPTWILLEFAAEWRWMRNRTDSPWYPTMRLFRQPKPGDWDSVAAAAADALSRLPQPQ